MKRVGSINSAVVIAAAAVCSVFCALFPLNPVSWTITSMIASVLAYIYLTDRRGIVFIYAVPAYLISLALTGQWGISLISTVAYPVSLLLIIAVDRGMRRTRAVSLMTGGGAFYIISAVVISAYDIHGGFNAPELLSDVQSRISAYAESLTLLMPRVQSIKLNEDGIQLVARIIFYASPAFLVLIAMFISYLATVFIKLWLKSGKVYFDYFSNDWGIRANFTAAVAYIIAVLALAFTASGGISAVFVTALNVTVVLTPLMFIVGAKKLIGLLTRRDSVVLTIAAITVIIILAAVNILIPVAAVSIYGVAMIIMGGLRLIVLTNIR